MVIIFREVSKGRPDGSVNAKHPSRQRNKLQLSFNLFWAELACIPSEERAVQGYGIAGKVPGRAWKLDRVHQTTGTWPNLISVVNKCERELTISRDGNEQTEVNNLVHQFIDFGGGGGRWKDSSPTQRMEARKVKWTIWSTNLYFLVGGRCHTFPMCEKISKCQKWSKRLKKKF